MKKNLKSLIITMLICFAFSPSPDASPITITFKDSVTLNDTVVQLKDIAEIQGTSELKAELNVLYVGDAAPAGFSRLISRDDILVYYIQPKFKASTFVPQGASRTKVSTSFIEKKIGNYLPEITGFLKNNVLWPEDSWELSILNSDVTFKCLELPCTVTFSGLLNKNPRGPFNFAMIVSQGSKQLRVPLNCHLKVTLPVVTTRTRIDREQVITTEMCSLTNMDITSLAIQPYTKVSDIAGKRAKRTIEAGSPVNKQWLQSVPDIEKGDPVQIIAVNRSVKIAVAGTAREAGCCGEKIWVENSASHKLVRVVIKSKGIVALL